MHILGLNTIFVHYVRSMDDLLASPWDKNVVSMRKLSYREDLLGNKSMSPVTATIPPLGFHSP